MPCTLLSNVLSMRTYSCSREPSTGSRGLRPAPPGMALHDVSAAKRPVSARFALLLAPLAEPASSLRSPPVGFVAIRLRKSEELISGFANRYGNLSTPKHATAGINHRTRNALPTVTAWLQLLRQKNNWAG